MFNYIKLQFSYLFSNLFIICYGFIMSFILVGFVVSGNIDLGYYYLDGFRHDFYIEYLQQSYLVIEIILTLASVFVTTMITSKSNDFLMVYTVNNYYMRFLFITSRIIVLVIFNVLSVTISTISFIIFTNHLTPYSLDLDLLIELSFLIIYQMIALQGLALILSSIINHFLIILIPIILFWYVKTLFIANSLTKDIDIIVLKIIPAFQLDILQISVYLYFEYYLFPIFFMYITSIIINIFKDCK
jgi:hypothetical protein